MSKKERSSVVEDDGADIKSDHDDYENSKCSVTSPAVSGTSKTSYTQDLDTDLSAMEVKTSRIKTDLSLKRSRKSYQWIRRTINKELKNTDKINANYNFSLKISNFPTDWSLDEIKDVIVNDYGPVDYIYMAADDNMGFIGMVKLEFVSFTDCQKAWETFHGKALEEIKLFAEIRDLDEESDDEAAAPSKKKLCNRGPWRPDIDIWETDPRGLYGFQPEYLSSLGIQPPLCKWVQVTNFRCDKSELKEVMELAGQVLLCSVDTRFSKIGHVMYSHPLEAVQAVSMLNNQLFYGQPLKVTMQEDPGTKALLPKGLQAVGPGLGADGNPLRDIVKQYERFVQYKISYVNSTLFSNPDVLFSNILDSETPKNRNDIRDYSDHQNVYPLSNPIKYYNSASMNSGASNFGQSNGSTVGHSSQGLSGHMPVGNVDGWAVSGPRQILGPSPMSGPVSMQGPSPTSGPVLMQGLGSISGLGQMSGPGTMSGSGPVSGPGPMSGHVSMQGQGQWPSPILGPGSTAGPGPMAGSSAPMFGPGPQNAPHLMDANGSRPMGGSRPDNHVTLELSNLPLSTTFTLLCEKMSECGQVISVLLTSPGCAVVKFAQRQHAERCFKQYNNRVILGNRISVKLL